MQDKDKSSGAREAPQNAPQTPRERLEYLRGELRAERISYGELAELAELVEYIEPGDVELLEAAGVPEHAEPAEPNEEDATISPSGPLGARTSASYGHKHLGVYDSEEDALAAIADAMRAANFWPNVWTISDHGNAHLISARFYAEHPMPQGLDAVQDPSAVLEGDEDR